MTGRSGTAQDPDFLRLWLVGVRQACAGSSSGLRPVRLRGDGSALAATAVVASRQLPQLLFGAFAGAISEAVNRKTIVMLALIVPAVVSTVLATLATMDQLGLWHVALGNLVSGTMWATEMSTRRRMVGEVAGPHRIVPAIALDSATNAATRMVGPLLGGIAFEWLGMKGAYTFTALVQFAGAFAFAGLVHPQVVRRLDVARSGRDRRGPGLRLTKPTILWLGHHRRHQCLCLRLFGPGGAAWHQRLPCLAGPGRALAAAEPIGALAGGALIAAGVVRMDRRLTFAGGAALFMVALIVMALSPSYWLAFAVLVLGGFGTAGFGNMQTTLMLTEAPPDMRSRLMGIVTVGIGTGPLGVWRPA